MTNDPSSGEVRVAPEDAFSERNSRSNSTRETATFTGRFRTCSSSSANQSLPERVGRYQVLEWRGQGGFGVVYKAHDARSGKDVAIKVLRDELCDAVPHRVAFEKEAETAKRLSHGNLVQVFGLEHDENRRPFIVEQFVDGGSLLEWATTTRRSAADVVAMMIPVAEAIAYLHRSRLFHRDLKPNNILLDSTGKPYVSDFGLAVHESELQLRDGEVAGTFGYMAPEQIRGRTKRVDGRTDIWSLGVILYELLAGRLPFGGVSRPKSSEEYFAILTEAIEENDPEPLRTFAPELSRELEDICLRCLEKEKRHRFKTGDDLAEALRRYRDRQDRGKPDTADLLPVVSRPSIVPKGLRAFDRSDQDFFLDLLPGPRDRDGLPGCVSFWRDRLGTELADGRLDVCVVYGPSGSGKSSLIKAGVTPQLGEGVCVVTVECNAHDTESRLVAAIRRSLIEFEPDLPRDISLPELCQRLQQQGGRGRKFVLVLDQFEQWLHSHPQPRGTQLVQAIECCNGVTLQALLLVRDDFWMPLSRFTDELSISLREGENCAAVDLFDRKHARKVLILFGQAYGQLPATEAELSADQCAFLSRAIDELAENEHVICVRLSLFADLMRGRPWTTAELEAVGGAKGVGVKFLEEKFGPQAPAIYRVHRSAAQRVLTALLPPRGSELRGQMRTVEQLRVSADLPERSFQDLLRILDEDLKLLTPTTPAGVDPTDAELQKTSTGQYYQLTHDFLVPALGEWLTVELRRTRRGQALLRLRERSDDWNRRPEPRRLPTFAEWLAIHLLVNRRQWTSHDAHMMRSASRRIATWVAIALLGLVSLTAIGWEARGQNRARELRDRLVNFDTSRVPKVLSDAVPSQRWVRPVWERTYRDEFAAAVPSDSNADPLQFRRRLHLSLALGRWEPKKLDYVLDHLAQVDPESLPAVIEILAPLRGEVVNPFWARLESLITNQGKPNAGEVLATASVLAGIAPDDNRWQPAAAPIAKELVAARATQFSTWLRHLTPIAGVLKQPLLGMLRNQVPPGSGQRTQLLEAIARYAAADPAVLVAAVEEVAPAELPVLRDAALRLSTDVSRQAQHRLTELKTPRSAAPRTAAPSLAEHVATIEQHHGFIDEQAGYVVNLPREKYDGLSTALASEGYRPECFRPFDQADAQRVAASWRRDGRASRVLTDLTAAELADKNQAAVEEGQAIRDIARDSRGRWSALWVAKENGAGETRFYVDLPYAEHVGRLESWPKLGFLIDRFDIHSNPNEPPLATAIWRRGSDDPDVKVIVEARAGRTYGDLHPGLAQADLRLEQLAPQMRDRLALYERCFANLEDAAKEKPGAQKNNYEYSAGRYQLNGGQFDAALATFDHLNTPASSQIAECRAVTLLLLGRLDEAEKEIARFETIRTSRDARLKAAIHGQLSMVLALRQGNPSLALEKLAELEKSVQTKDVTAHELLVQARALCVQYLPPEMATESEAIRQRAIRSLQELIQRPETRLPEELVDRVHFDALRGDPAFGELLQQLALDHRLIAAWNERPDLMTKQLLAMEPAQHDSAARQLRNEGFLPRIVSAAPTEPAGGLQVCSVWEQPASLLGQEQLAARKIANLALILAALEDSMGLAGVLADNGGIEARSWAMEGAPSVIPVTTGVSLLRQSTSDLTRRNVLRLLGSYEPSAASDDERRYIDEQTRSSFPDSGTQAAASWLRRRWNLPDTNSNSVDSGSTQPAWYRNSLGQTMVVLDLRQPALIGSASNDPERAESERQHWVRVGRKVAVASTETTVRQFEEFLADSKVQAFYANKEFKSSKRLYAPSPDCPQISVRWYDAARYCQWLSEKEGLPSSDWCFPGIWQAEDGALELPSNILERHGYRLPTEAEMELACRGGSSSNRPYGSSPALLPGYAWFANNARGRAHEVGQLKPNDFGLFDVLGNVNEWCLDAYNPYLTPLASMTSDDHIDRATKAEVARVVRGGAFNGSGKDLRSADRNRSAPALNTITAGFRIARTHDPSADH